MSRLQEMPKSLLTKFLCSVCNVILSTSPISIKDDGQPVCFVCQKSIKSPMVRCKLLEDMASVYAFPCKYDGDGCSSLLPFNKSFDHEVACKYRTYSCPIIKCPWSGTTFQLVNHYKTHHRDFYLTAPNFKFYLHKEQHSHYLLQINRKIHLLQMHYHKAKKMAWINIIDVAKMRKQSSVVYKLKLTNECSQRSMEFEYRSTTSFYSLEMLHEKALAIDVKSLFALLQYCDFIICHIEIITPRSISDKGTHSALKCPNCDIQMVPPIYMCSSGHLTCVDCKYYNNTCGVCTDHNHEFSRAIDLENIAYVTQFLCRWKGCKKSLDCSKIRLHEQECLLREYKCPECQDHVGPLFKLSGHFKNYHKDMVFIIAKSQKAKFSSKSMLAYVYVHSEFFKVIITADVSNTHTVFITYHGPPSLATHFKYEIKDRYNVLYYASKCYKNHYKVTRPSHFINNVRSESYITIKFNKIKPNDIWIPLDYSSENTKYSTL